MKEAFLHYVWQYQQFESNNLETVDQEVLRVLKTGFHNTDAGPDFLEAKLKIGSLEWSGAVEIHVCSSDWYRHGHDNDPNYQNVVLHVVWEDDQPISYADKRKIPTIVLKNKVSLGLIHYYEELIKSRAEIACANSWPAHNPFIVKQMLESSLVERLHQKSLKATTYFAYTRDDWEATTYYMLLSAFGFKVNAHGFERLAYLLPYELIRKYKTQAEVLEVLFFGVAGFLEEQVKGSMKQKMKKEWEYLRHKHKLDSIMAKHEWNFLRLRPANFPTTRLSQVVALMQNIESLFQSFVLHANVASLKRSLKLKGRDIWHMENPDQIIWTRIGEQSIHHLIMNVCSPMLALYAKKLDDISFMEKAFNILEELKPEDNKITRKYTQLGEHLKSAYESQAFLQLYSSYCQPKRCLNCKVGLAIMKDTS